MNKYTVKPEARIIRFMAWNLYPHITKNIEHEIARELIKELLKIERILYLSLCSQVPHKTLLQTVDSIHHMFLVVDNTNKSTFEREEYRLLDFLSYTAQRWLSSRLSGDVYYELRASLCIIKDILNESLNKDRSCTLYDATQKALEEIGMGGVLP